MFRSPYPILYIKVKGSCFFEIFYFWAKSEIICYIQRIFLNFLTFSTKCFQYPVPKLILADAFLGRKYDQRLGLVPSERFANDFRM